jgi:hypothetical protein
MSEFEHALSYAQDDLDHQWCSQGSSEWAGYPLISINNSLCSLFLMTF